VLARWETREAATRGSANISYRDEMPPTLIQFARPFRTTVEVDQDRALLEGRWRASKAWRLRAGAERIEERIRGETPDPDAWDPDTTAALAGFDWTPSDRVDLSVLGRGSRTGGSTTALSAEDAEALSARLRLKRPDGWRMTAFSRLKSREREGRYDSGASVDAYGITFGREAGKDGWLDLSIGRHDFSLASDTRFVTDTAISNLKSPHRVRYDEEVTGATLDFSIPVSGPLRTFASARAAIGRGDLPYRQHDAALGLGWRLSAAWDLRLEGRHVAYRESDRDYDDYGATIVTLSVLWEF
jgi:hypothetical protein